MTARKYVDNAPTTTVSASINSSVTSFTVASLAGFPATFPYSATLGLGTASAEQVLVTAAVGTTVTVTRNSNGQGAFSHPAGETFDHTAVAQDYSEANAHVNAASGVHGVTGAVVGTTDSQTLTNKTLTAPEIDDPVLKKSGQALTFPAGPDTLVGRASTDTLLNKTLTTPTINGGAQAGVALDAASTIGGLSGTAIGLLPNGRVAGAVTASNTIGIAGTTLLIVGLSDIALTAVAGRRYKVTVSISDFKANGGTAVTTFSIRDGGASAPTTSSTVLAQFFAAQGSNSQAQSFHFELTGLSAGTHRLGLTAATDGATSAQLTASATKPATITIEDIGV